MMPSNSLLQCLFIVQCTDQTDGEFAGVLYQVVTSNLY